MKNKYMLMSDISKAVQSLLVDTSEGKYILEEATVDEGKNRTVIRISVIPTSALKKDYLQERNLECGCPTNRGTERKETPDYSIQVSRIRL